jgi:hypothetical protein
MPMDPLSGAASYCSAARFVRFFDVRTLGDLLSDDGTRLTPAQVLASDELDEILKCASGKVECAAQVAERYRPADLEALLADDGNMASFLAWVVAGLAVEMVFQRRPDVDMKVPSQAAEANEILNALAHGERIFGFTETMDAGHMDHEVETPRVVEDRNLPTYQARSLFGTRSNRVTRIDGRPE